MSLTDYDVKIAVTKMKAKQWVLYWLGWLPSVKQTDMMYHLGYTGIIARTISELKKPLMDN